jgi:hypothetical protein
MEPTKNDLNQWTELYGPLFNVTIEGKEFICKEISRKDYKKIVERYEDVYEQEEAICKECVLYPSPIDFESSDAGLPTAITAEILRESGFGDSPKVTQLVEKYRTEMDNFMNQVSCIIHEAFPMLDLEVIEGWPLEKTLWYYSRAEWKMRQFRGMVQQEQEQGDIQGNPEDFPELAAEKAFLSGKKF